MCFESERKNESTNRDSGIFFVIDTWKALFRRFTIYDCHSHES